MLFVSILSGHRPDRVWLCLFALLMAAQSGQTQDLAQLDQVKPFDIQGNIEARAVFYDANGIPARYLPFNYLISGTPVLSVYSVQIPVYFSFSRQQSSFTQPFNQFGLSPQYKWITVHGGYRNLHYSPFTLAGHTFLGGGVDLRPGKWRFSGMYGRFNKATVLDTLQGVYIENFSYKRIGYAARVGYGTDASYFDLIALHAQDEPGSAPAARAALLDSLKITPAENWVTGYQTRLTFLQGKLIFESDGAVSIYTADRRLPAIEDSTLRDDLSFVERFVHVNYSTEIYSAFQASLAYRVKRMGVKLQYRRIDPGYRSMGAYFLNNDLENWTVNPTLTLWQGRIRFVGSLGFQRDNLQDKKRATSHRVIGAANLTADLTERWGIDLSYTNFSNTQRAGTVRFADSLRVAQSTQNLSISPRYMKLTALHSHSVLLSFNLNTFRELNDQRTLEGTGNDITTQTYFATYQLGFTAARASLFLTANYARLGNDQLQDRNSGLTLGASKPFAAGKVVLTGSTGYILSDRNGEQGYMLNESLQVRYTLHPKHSVQAMVVFLGNYPDQVSEIQRRFTELRAEIGYNFNF
jgi:hypothetical protein